METTIEKIEYYVRPESDGKYEVVKMTSNIKLTLDFTIDEMVTSNSEVVYSGRLSDCESFINLTDKGLLRNE